MTRDDGAATRRCAWCAAVAADGLTQCAGCGAALAQRETIGDLIIPGVTHIDPNLQSYAAEPLRIPAASASQSAAGGVIEALAGGGPGLAALGALAAMAATEYLSAGRGGAGRSASGTELGRPSQAVLDMVRRLDGDPASRPTTAGVSPDPTLTIPGDYALPPPTLAPAETFEETIKRLDSRLATAGSSSEPENTEIRPDSL